MTRFEFIAQISAVKPTMGKPGTYQETAKNGSLEITLRVNQPQMPPRPQLGWNLRSDRDPNEAKPRPTKSTLKKDKDETVEAHEARKAEDLEQQQRQYDHALSAYHDAMNEWSRGAAGHSERLLAYAQLIGLSSVFGGQDVACVLTPQMQDMLPGFSTSLLALPDGPSAEFTAA